MPHNTDGAEVITSPPPGAPDMPAFLRIFDATAASYKFLWFMAILDLLPDKRSGDCALPLPPLVLRMLENAEEPLRRFRLQFGYHDKMAGYLNMAEEYPDFIAARDKGDNARAAHVLGTTSVYRKILAMAPLFLLSPFLPVEANKKAQGVVRKLSKQLADEGRPPLYYFSGDSIIIPAAWADYLRENRDVIRGWTMWHWACFLQARNPNIPGVVSKILKPSKSALSIQRDFWKCVIQNAPENAVCIYSGKKLAGLLPTGFVVDHFLSWEFVCHDNLWNLAPTYADINMSKGAKLPGKEFVYKLARLHHLAIGVYHSFLRGSKKYGREEMMLSYATDLGINAHEDTPELADLEEAYMRVVPAWMALAKNRGFKEWNGIDGK